MTEEDDIQADWDELERARGDIRRGRGRRLKLKGHRIGRLVVGDATGTRDEKTGSALWNVTCDCGETKVLSTNALMSGRVKSCGCLLRERKNRA